MLTVQGLMCSVVVVAVTVVVVVVVVVVHWPDLFSGKGDDGTVA